MSAWKVLVPVEILEGESVPDALLTALSSLPVVVLGYHVLPEQTPPGQARLQFEAQAQGKLDELADAFRAAGGAAETRLVFTHDEEQTIQRVANETDCGAIVIPNPTATIERLLVPLGSDVDVERILSFVAALVDGRALAVRLYDVSGTEDAVATDRDRLEAASDQLESLGVPAGAIETSVEVSETPVHSIARAASDHDAVVMGERAPSLRSFVFGDETERVATSSLGPVIVVRRDSNADQDQS